MKTKVRGMARRKGILGKMKESKLTSEANLAEREIQLLMLISEIGIERTLVLISQQLNGSSDYRGNSYIESINKRLEKIELWIQNQSEESGSAEESSCYVPKNEDLKEFIHWNQVLSQIQQQISKPSYDTWLRNTSAMLQDDDVVIVFCKNEFQRDWLEERYRQEIFFTVKEVAGRTYEIEFEVLI
ncbi:hypothetical protein CU633_14215 [Bacillus sp. V3-13]|uniref:DnaA N-terminal domain-containing protein n=1 Tax=Bacillus sp. V3-13 TaxID=2053728 RepID=UPI000C7730E5|nr:DnaA N-terminal domain-containing protein [Bacillus sp. V3-13]PLR76709.1 hypothetical protein CU633_14215 [Bacillus sp. V3-13]